MSNVHSHISHFSFLLLRIFSSLLPFFLLPVTRPAISWLTRAMKLRTMARSSARPIASLRQVWRKKHTRKTTSTFHFLFSPSAFCFLSFLFVAKSFSNHFSSVKHSRLLENLRRTSVRVLIFHSLSLLYLIILSQTISLSHFSFHHFPYHLRLLGHLRRTGVWWTEASGSVSPFGLWRCLLWLLRCKLPIGKKKPHKKMQHHERNNNTAK